MGYSQLIIRFLLCCCMLVPMGLSAQTAVVNGYIRNNQNGDTLAMASVLVDGKKTGKADSTGYFMFTLEPGKHSITVSLVGYKSETITIQLGFEERKRITIYLTPKINELDRVVVSGSRQEKSIAREIMSVTSVKSTLIENTNAKSLSEVLNYVPGVNVIEGQANIRGLSGWSYGVGSRVMVLLDDMPLMGPDLGDIQWDLLPIEAAENIEVMKGPSSVLYGGSASTGTINVRTGWPTNKPVTKVTFFQGVQDNPRNKNAIWWERTTQPFNTGAFLVHKQKIKQFDLVGSANVFANRSHIQENDEFRARAYLKTRYRFQKVKGLSVGINGTVMAKKAGRFFIWNDGDSNMLKPFDGEVGYDKYSIYMVDPHVTLLRNKYTVSAKYRYYHINRDGTFGSRTLTPTNDAVARINALDVSVIYQLTKRLTSTSGLYGTSFNAVGNVYPGDRTGYSGAAFTQLEYQIKRWNFTAGGRYEANALGAIQQTQRPLFRFGVNYQAARNTFIRATYGEGFRFPTIAERYVEDNASGLEIFPNPGLKTERGWYTEVGVKQGFTIGGFNAFADACFYWMEYQNMIEFLFNQQERARYYFDTVTFQLVVVGRDRVGFRAENRDLSRTAGIELSLEGEGKIGPVYIRTLCGYNYAYPIDLNADPSMQNAGNYMKAFRQNFAFMDSGHVGLNSLIPYRNRHLGKIDIECSYKKVSFGYNAQYTSIYEKIDEPLYVIAGLRNFLNQSQPGDWVHNLRAAFAFTPQFTLSVLVNNLTNHTYASRPTRIEAFRSVNLQMRISL